MHYAALRFALSAIGLILAGPGLVLAAGGEKPDLLSPRLDLGIWTVVVFVGLYLVLKKTAWKPMLEGLKKREDTIQGALDEARRTQEEARRLKGQLQEEMNKASEKVRDMIEEARRDAQHTTDEMLTKARSDIQTDRERMRRELDTARDQALKDLWEQTAQLATLVSAKAIARNLTVDDHRRLITEAMSEMGQRVTPQGAQRGRG